MTSGGNKNQQHNYSNDQYLNYYTNSDNLSHICRRICRNNAAKYIKNIILANHILLTVLNMYRGQIERVGHNLKSHQKVEETSL